MSLNREDLKTWFFLKDFSNLPCPYCKKGKLNPKEEVISEKETKESIKYTSKEGSDYQAYEGNFVAVFKCTISECNERTIIVGKSGYSEDMKEDNDGQFDFDIIKCYKPEYFYPAPELFPIQKKFPSQVTDELKQSFSLFWIDPSSAGNKIRVAVERMLDEFRIAKFTKNKKPLVLHIRIQEFCTKHPKYSHLLEPLLAIKWLGNDGSHASDLTKEDVLDSLDILELILEEIYINKRETLFKLAIKIHQNKGKLKKTNQNDLPF